MRGKGEAESFPLREREGVRPQRKQLGNRLCDVATSVSYTIVFSTRNAQRSTPMSPHRLLTQSKIDQSQIPSSMHSVVVSCSAENQDAGESHF